MTFLTLPLKSLRKPIFAGTVLALESQCAPGATRPRNPNFAGTWWLLVSQMAPGRQLPVQSQVDCFEVARASATSSSVHATLVAIYSSRYKVQIEKNILPDRVHLFQRRLREVTFLSVRATPYVLEMSQYADD